MSGSYPEDVENVVRTVGNAFNTGTVFEGEQASAVREASRLGLLNIVPHNLQPFRMRDGSEMFGVELTVPGMRFLGIDPHEYYKK